MTASLQLRQVSRTLADELVIDGINLTVLPGEQVALLAQPAAGHGQLLHGINSADSSLEGDILLAGKPVAQVLGYCRLVDSQAQLISWLSVRENIALALDSLVLSSADRNARLTTGLLFSGLAAVENHRISQLRDVDVARVALTRAMVTAPRLLLLDEPFYRLDAISRFQLQQLASEWCRQQHVALVLATHDTDEAALLAERVVVLSATPLRIRRTITVSLPFPRDRFSPALLSIKRTLANELDGHEPEESGGFVDFRRAGQFKMSW